MTGRPFTGSSEDYVAGEIQKLERESKLQLDELELQKTLGPKLAEARKDDLIKQAVLKTAEDIVSRVMRDNATAMNEAIGKQVEALVGDQTALIQKLVEATVEKRLAKFLEDLRSLDSRERGGFLEALSEIDLQPVIRPDGDRGGPGKG